METTDPAIASQDPGYSSDRALVTPMMANEGATTCIGKKKRRRALLLQDALPDASSPPSRPHHHHQQQQQQQQQQQSPSAHTTPDSNSRKRRKRTATPTQAGSSQGSCVTRGGFALGANGRPIVFAGVKYSVDVASLRAYAGTEEAVHTKRLKHTYKNGAPMTDRERIDKFLKHVQATASGDGLCTVSYTRSEIGQALVDAGFIRHARVYPDAWPSCITNLGGSSLRAVALGKFYGEMDDKDAFHKLLHSLTDNRRAKELIGRILSDASLKPTLSEHYFGTPDRVGDIKALLHSMSNGGAPDAWRRECGATSHDDPPFVVELQSAMSEVTRELASTGVGSEAVKFIAERFPVKMTMLPDPRPDEPYKMKCVEEARDPERCWKSYLLQEKEMLGLLAKMKVAERYGASCGPPLHDCLFVEKSACSESMAAAMSTAVFAALGVAVQVRPKELETRGVDPDAFHLRFKGAQFDDKDFVPNTHLTSAEAIEASLAEYNRWLGRFFVCVVKEKNPMVAQVFYYSGTDRIQEVICRSHEDTKATFLEMRVVVEASNDPKKPPATSPLLAWYLRLNIRRRTAEHVNMWTSPDDIANHPEDLNTFGGLGFDGRYASEPATERVPFRDPFPRGPLPRMVSGLKPVDAQVPVASPDAEWRGLEGLRFLLWHLKYILCGGDEHAFEYLMQWFGYIFQTRRKPGVMPQFLSEAEGTGKSAIFGHNQSGPGLIARIYGQYYQWSDDIDRLLGKFNHDSMNRLFCVMEEAGTYRKGHRDWNRVKSLITEGKMTVEIKNLNSFCANDNRAFAMLTNNRDSLKVTDSSRRFLCCEGNDDLSQKAVHDGRCSQELRREYMAKLDRTKNDDEIAYAFFRYCMGLDLSDFQVGEPPRTALFEEQRSHNECAVKRFLLDARSGAYPLKTNDYQVLRGEQKLTALELFAHLKKYMSESGAVSNIDSAMSLGHCLAKRYQTLAPKLEGRVCKYLLALPG